jgi:hypothetical protein
MSIVNIEEREKTVYRQSNGKFLEWIDKVWSPIMADVNKPVHGLLFDSLRLDKVIIEDLFRFWYPLRNDVNLELNTKYTADDFIDWIKKNYIPFISLVNPGIPHEMFDLPHLSQDDYFSLFKLWYVEYTQKQSAVIVDPVPVITPVEVVDDVSEDIESVSVSEEESGEPESTPVKKSKKSNRKRKR